MRGEKNTSPAAADKNITGAYQPGSPMQALGVFSFLCCVITMYGVYQQWVVVTSYVFALSLLSLLASLIISLLEISQSTKALEWELSDMEELEKSNFFSDLWGKGNEKKEP